MKTTKVSLQNTLSIVNCYCRYSQSVQIQVTYQVQI